MNVMNLIQMMDEFELITIVRETEEKEEVIFEGRVWGVTGGVFGMNVKKIKPFNSYSYAMLYIYVD